MKRIIIILFIVWDTLAVTAQKDTTNILTTITTGEYMENGGTSGSGGIDWSALMSRDPRNPGCVGCPCDNCTDFFGWIWGGIKTALNAIAGLFNGESGGGTGGYDWGIPPPFSWGNNLGGNPPPSSNPGIKTGGGGSTTPVNPNVVITTPPTKPEIQNEDGSISGGGAVVQDSMATKVPCDTAAILRGLLADSIWNELDSTGIDKKRLQDSAKSGKFESSFQIKRSNNKFITTNFFTSTSATSVLPPTTTDTLYGGAHCHQDTSGINSQSPGDFYRMLSMFKKYPATYKIDFLTSYDNLEWAIMIADSNAATICINDTTFTKGIVMSGPDQGDWSDTNISQKTGITYYKTFFDYGNKMFDRRYPENLQTAFANIYMVNKMFNTGIKVLMKVDGKFKEVNCFEDDSTGVTILKIKICE